MQIQGHRGGFQPENTMKCFGQAIEAGIEAIEIDIWLTNDGVPIILHGGDNGELNHHFEFQDTHYIFEKSYSELLQYDLGDGQKIPTLEDLIIFNQKRLFINIELKVPREENVKSRYNYLKCSEKIFELIKKHNISQNHIETIYLMNFHQEPLPEPSAYTDLGHGINVSSKYITQEVVDLCHMNGQKVGVWVSSKVEIESDVMYERLLKMGVDFVCSDYPLSVLAAQTRYHEIHTLMNSDLECISDQSCFSETIEDITNFESDQIYSESGSEKYFIDSQISSSNYLPIYESE
ncbi:glycerophosphoryl diester phosphodiesterase [Stylonychia lemnae]|uniref:Glycerophosphoryl diester phosphodiesterase n=1 Tax=Stylonychia lemnae TaxID=5949 RepID=A0A078APP8_STYLE|nr:glycerophosphoryl diester phosphodiesterase [Stylonychia lemnae]|eukprot:CDW84350.1 glycerophosphoryl diester phosphodiesterase [Stylonychia lemnae]